MSEPICPAAAAPTPPQAPFFSAPAQWQAAVDNVMEHGTFRQANEMVPATLGLQSIRGPRSGTHQADYMNVAGRRDTSGQFHGGYVSIVSEKWELRDEGKFYIEQWIHRLSLDGTSDRVTHSYVVKNVNHRVFDMGTLPVAPGEAEANLAAVVATIAQLPPPAPQASHDVLESPAATGAARALTTGTAKPEVLETPRGGAFSLRAQ